MPHLCECCGLEGASKVCSGCNTTCYCSRACQIKHWKAGHKLKCVKAEPRVARPVPAPSAAPAVSSAGGAASATGGDEETGEECAICLDELQQPQTMPCGHRFCRNCVDSMRRHGITEVQVCPLCRGAMPDVERMMAEAAELSLRFTMLNRRTPLGATPGRDLLDRTRALYRQVLAIDPRHGPANRELGCVLGDINATSAQIMDAHEAEEALRRAIEIDPADAQALRQLGELLEHKRADFDGAEVAYRAAVGADPSCVYSTTSLATFLAHHRDDAHGAEALFRRAMKLDPSYSAAPSNLGGMLIYTGKLSEAEVAVRAALAADDEFADSHWHLGDIFIRRARKAKDKRKAAKLLRKAEKSLRRALVLFPQHAEARNLLALLLGNRGALDEAEAFAVEDTQNGLDRLRWNRARCHYNNAGKMMEQQTDMPETLAAYRAAMSDYPFDRTTDDVAEFCGQEFGSNLLSDLGALFVDHIGDPTRGAVCFCAGISRDSAHPQCNMNLGHALMQLDDFAAAARAFRRGASFEQCGPEQPLFMQKMMSKKRMQRRLQSKLRRFRRKKGRIRRKVAQAMTHGHIVANLQQMIGSPSFWQV